jgi:membrane dipeptidase
MSADPNAEWKEIHFERSTIVDLHAHPSLKVALFRRKLAQRFRASKYTDPFSVHTDFPKLKESGLDVLLSTVYAPEHGIAEECAILKLLRYVMPRTWKQVYGRTPFAVAMDMLDRMEREVQKSVDPETGKPYAKMAFSLRELEECLQPAGGRGDRPIAVVHNIEGAHSLDGKLENVQRFFDRGVAYLTLGHFYENEAVHPVFPYPESAQVLGCFQGDRNVALGLKPFGEQVIEKMMELGMILDVAHCTPPARRRIYDITGKRRPLIASHVGAYEINPSAYNPQDWEIKQIADTGGVVGVIFMNYWLMPHETGRGLNYIARTIRHFADVGGIDCVAIGTDFDGFTDPPDDLIDFSQLPKLTQRLIAEGYSSDQIAKILGGNALRVLREGWGKKE